MTRAARALGALVALALLLAGCGGGGPSGGGTAAPASSSASSAGTSSSASASGGSSAGSGDVQYVALGDSYAAAPGLPPQDTAGDAPRCARSLANYPHLLAGAEPTLSLTDVTCSGATSDDVIKLQDPALSPDTDLVTLTIGGNDGGLFITLIGGCVQLAAGDPTGDPCTQFGQKTVTATLATIRTNVSGVLDDIEKRAPNAHVVVVGYPQLLPASGSGCPKLAPIATGDLPFVTQVNHDLSGALEAAAKAHGDDFVDVYAASSGHDVCSAHPWVNGQTTAADSVIPFHPFAAEQHAVAGLVARVL